MRRTCSGVRGAVVAADCAGRGGVEGLCASAIGVDRKWECRGVDEEKWWQYVIRVKVKAAL